MDWSCQKAFIIFFINYIQITLKEILSSNQTDSSTGSTTAATTADSAQSAVVSTADPSVPRGNAQGHKCVYLARFRQDNM